MINANQITSRLRMMSDQELQRFAEMHKQDPYMFPLAFNESNMRKEMRSAPQGQGAAPQAPVNQQALAAMQPAQLPEDQGIGALNPNMQFADGGLVSFAGGGESTAGPYARADDRDFGTGGVAYADGGTIRFAEGEEVPSPRYGRGLIPNAPYRMAPYGGYDYSPEAVAERKAQREQEALAAPPAEDASKKAWQNELLRLKAEQQKTAFSGRDTAGIDAKIAELEKSRPESMKAKEYPPEPPMPRRVLRSPSDTRASFDLPPVPTGTGSPLEQQKALVNARVADAKANAPGAALPSAPGGPLPSGFPIPGASGASGAGNVPLPSMSGGPGAMRAPGITAVAPRAPGGLPPVGEDYRSAPAIEKMFGKYVTDAETEAQKRIEEYQKDRPAPETFAEQKALLEENRADVEKESRMNEGLAWLTFASRVVQPGKNTIQALVEGASAGGEQYARAQKDLKKAEKERKMGLAALAQAERAEKRNDYDKVEMYKQQAMQRADKARDASVLALSHATGEDTKIAAQRMDSALNRQSQEGIAAAGNATTLQAAQMRLDAEQREAQLRYAAGQAKLNADDFDQLMKFVQTPQGMVMTPPEAVAAYARMKATYGAVRSSPTVVDTPGTRAP